MKHILAKCLKTYPDEDDMQRWCDGEDIELCDITIYYKGRKYYVAEELYNKEYYKIIEPIKYKR